MLGKYQFKKVYGMNSFQEETPSPISFPINDSAGFPGEVRDKAEELIDGLIHDNSLQDLSKLSLDARIQVCFNNEGSPVLNISVFITDDRDLCIQKDIAVHNGDPLYEPVRKYFMQQLEKVLFVE